MEHVCLKEVLKECKDEAVSSLLRTALEKLAEAGRLADRKSAVK
jgi:hypothetical protein